MWTLSLSILGHYWEGWRRSLDGGAKKLGPLPGAPLVRCFDRAARILAARLGSSFGYRSTMVVPSWAVIGWVNSSYRRVAEATTSPALTASTLMVYSSSSPAARDGTAV